MKHFNRCSRKGFGHLVTSVLYYCNLIISHGHVIVKSVLAIFMTFLEVNSSEIFSQNLLTRGESCAILVKLSACMQVKHLRVRALLYTEEGYA